METVISMYTYNVIIILGYSWFIMSIKHLSIIYRRNKKIGKTCVREYLYNNEKIINYILFLLFSCKVLVIVLINKLDNISEWYNMNTLFYKDSFSRILDVKLMWLSTNSFLIQTFLEFM